MSVGFGCCARCSLLNYCASYANIISDNSISPPPLHMFRLQTKNCYYNFLDKIFRWHRWGSSRPGLRTLDPPLSPPLTPAEIWCKFTSKHLLQPLRSHIQSFRTIGQLLKLTPLSAQKCHSAGGKGGSPIFVVDGNPNI